MVVRMCGTRHYFPCSGSSVIHGSLYDLCLARQRESRWGTQSEGGDTCNSSAKHEMHIIFVTGLPIYPKDNRV